MEQDKESNNDVANKKIFKDFIWNKINIIIYISNIIVGSYKDFFEIGNLFKSFNDKECAKQFFTEIQAIYDMIDYFKLDEKIKL